jgi:hypothetical protein
LQPAINRIVFERIQAAADTFDFDIHNVFSGSPAETASRCGSDKQNPNQRAESGALISIARNVQLYDEMCLNDACFRSLASLIFRHAPHHSKRRRVRDERRSRRRPLPSMQSFR